MRIKKSSPLKFIFISQWLWNGVDKMRLKDVIKDQVDQ